MKKPKNNPKLTPVSPIIKDKNGNIIGFNLAADAANDDWIRAARLPEEERKKMEQVQMYTFKDEEE